MEINTVAELVRAVSDEITGGYETTELEIVGNQEKARITDPDSGATLGFWLILVVTFSNPEMRRYSGEYWFWDDNTVMQVL